MIRRLDFDYKTASPVRWRPVGRLVVDVDVALQSLRGGALLSPGRQVTIK
jgi:hypothetical protein